MTQLQTKFIEYSTGSAPGDWTERWRPLSGSLNVAVLAGGLGGKMLELNSPAAALYAASWDDIGSPADVEILVKARATGDAIRIFARGGGNAGTENAYYISMDIGGDKLYLVKYVNGSATAISQPVHTFNANTWYWLRFRISGTSLRARAWANGDSEPGTWEIDTTDGSITAGGWVGPGFVSNDVDVDFISVGTDGDSALDPDNWDISDTMAAGDSADAVSMSGIISDSMAASDSVDGYNTSDAIADEIAAGDSADALFDGFAAISDGAAAGDSADAGFELFGDLADSCAMGDSADAFNWSAWLRANRDLAVVRYHCTLTGAADSTTDIELPISSFQARKRTDESNYLSVVVPGYAYAEPIAARPNGDLFIEMAYEIAGVEVLREEIIRVDLEQINPQRGPRSRSITLIGHRLVEYDPRAASIAGCNYTYTYDGSRGYRFPQVDPYLNPGDSLTVEDTGDALTVDYITYAIAAKGAKFMEVRE